MRIAYMLRHFLQDALTPKWFCLLRLSDQKLFKFLIISVQYAKWPPHITLLDLLTCTLIQSVHLYVALPYVLCSRRGSGPPWLVFEAEQCGELSVRCFNTEGSLCLHIISVNPVQRFSLLIEMNLNRTDLSADRRHVNRHNCSTTQLPRFV
jgi:hypothetical protein